MKIHIRNARVMLPDTANMRAGNGAGGLTGTAAIADPGQASARSARSDISHVVDASDTPLSSDGLREARVDVFIDAGVIAGLGTAPDGFYAGGEVRIVDAAGRILAPGLVDLDMRFDPRPQRVWGENAGLNSSAYAHTGSESDSDSESGWDSMHDIQPNDMQPDAAQATYASERVAAAAGGVTHLICPPDQMPVFAARGVYPLGALTAGLSGSVLSDMAALAEAGCIGVSQGDRPIGDSAVLLQAMHYARTVSLPVWLRPQDAALARGGVAASGALASRLGLSGVSEAAETIALQTIFALMRETGARVHLSHISSAAGVALVRAAKREGLPVSADVTIHHLHLVDIDIGWFDTRCRFDPPLRGTRDRDALRDGLLDGTIDAICSNHVPLSIRAKRRPFADALPGASAVELLLALTVKWAQENRVPLSRALRFLTTGPARAAGLSATGTARATAATAAMETTETTDASGISAAETPLETGQNSAQGSAQRTVSARMAGRIAVGASADLVLFDPDDVWQVMPDRLRSAGRTTPYAGWELPAPVHMTWIGGEVVFSA